jgi:catechol 2,3-dioxygenase-like lactoylglutathione lyase family enzyme
MLRHVKFAELPVLDQDRAVRFYTGKLGLGVFADSPDKASWRWLEFAIPGAETKILVTRRSGPPREEPAIVFVVDDVAATHRALAAKGVEFTLPPTPAPWSADETYALFRDSEDNIVMIGSG